MDKLNLETDEAGWDKDFIHHVDTKTQVVIVRHEKNASIIGGRYLKGALLGEGSYAKVKEMLDVLSLHRRAVKIISDQRLKKIQGGKANVAREIELLRVLHHEHVIKLIEVMYMPEKSKLYLVLEYCVCPLGELQKNAKDEKFPIVQAHDYFCQIICGVEYLHSQRVIHKDLKPDNLLLSLDGIVKICDFGVAERLELFSPDDTITMSQGSPVFQPPEVSVGHDTIYGFKLDVWSCGVTLYHFVSNDYPFMGETLFQLFEIIGRGEYTMPSGLSEPLEDLIRGMLEPNPVKRLGVQQIKRHPWFTSSYQLSKKESLVRIPALADYDDDELRSMTTVDSLKALHKHNLPTCPLLLSEEHMVYLLRNSTQLPHGPGSSQLVHDGLLEAAAASFTVAGVSATGDSPNSKPITPSITSQSDGSMLETIRYQTPQELEFPEPDLPVPIASPAPAPTTKPSVLQRLTPALKKLSNPESGSLNGSAVSLEKNMQYRFKRSASTSSAPYRTAANHSPLRFRSVDDTALPAKGTNFRHRAFTSSDAGDGLNVSFKRIFRPSGSSANAIGVENEVKSETRGEIGRVPRITSMAPRDSQHEIRRSFDMGLSRRASGGSGRSGKSARSVGIVLSDSNHSMEHHTACRRSSVDSNRQQKGRQQTFSRSKVPSSPDISCGSVRSYHSNPPSPSRLSNGSNSKRASLASNTQPDTSVHFPARQGLRRVLSTKEEDEDELAEDSRNSRNEPDSGDAHARAKRRPFKRFRRAHCRQQ